MWKIKLSLSFGQANFCSGSVVLVNVADRHDLSFKKEQKRSIYYKIVIYCQNHKNVLLWST